MATELQTRSLRVDMDPETFDALKDLAKARSSTIRKVSVAEIVRTLIADLLTEDARIPSATR